MKVQLDKVELIKYITANGEALKIVGWTIVEMAFGAYKFNKKCVILENLSSN